jgi:hypothetical protein
MANLNTSWEPHPEGYLGDALKKVLKGEIPIIRENGLKVSAARDLAQEQLKHDIPDGWE